MKTILVVFSKDSDLTVEKANNSKLKKYTFNIDDDISVGDWLTSQNYNSPFMVTDVLATSYMYYNSSNGELMNEINSTSCYPIKVLKIVKGSGAIIATRMN